MWAAGVGGGDREHRGRGTGYRDCDWLRHSILLVGRWACWGRPATGNAVSSGMVRCWYFEVEQKVETLEIRAAKAFASCCGVNLAGGKEAWAVGARRIRGRCSGLGARRRPGRWGRGGGRGDGGAEAAREMGARRRPGRWGRGGGQGDGGAKAAREMGARRRPGRWGRGVGQGDGGAKAAREMGARRRPGRWGREGGRGDGGAKAAGAMGARRRPGRWGREGGRGDGGAKAAGAMGQWEPVGLWVGSFEDAFSAT